MARFAVIGAGVSGLCAAWQLEKDGHDVVLFEAADRVGGKLQQSDVVGLDFPLDEGADAFLARVPDALELCDELGIDDLVHPAVRNAWVYANGALVPLPSAQLLGVPTDLDVVAASGLLSPAGLERARQDLGSEAPPVVEDCSVRDLIAGRLGPEVCDHLVEPLLGGINGGSAEGLSVEATAPQIWSCAQRGGSLIRAAAAIRANAPGDPNDPPPVFAAPAAGMAEIPRRLAGRLVAERRLSCELAPLRMVGGQVCVADDEFDGAVLAVPADEAGHLTAAVCGDASALLGAIDFASVVMVTLVVGADTIEHPLDGSGFVVARTAGLSITACSWGSSKWAHWNDGSHAVFRVSLGHDADPTDWGGRSDGELIATACRDLRTVMGIDIEPVGSRVGRWGRSFPQYRPGHLQRMHQVRSVLHDVGPIAVAGMSFDGIGVPASIRSGRSAARSVAG